MGATFVFERDAVDDAWPMTGHLSDDALRFIRPADLTSEAMAAEAMDRLANIAAHIEDQVDRAKAECAATGIYSDQKWFFAAKRALKGAKAALQTVQTRRGELRRAEKAAAHAANMAEQTTSDRRFVKAAHAVLSPLEIRRVLDMADRMTGES